MTCGPGRKWSPPSFPLPILSKTLLVIYNNFSKTRDDVAPTINRWFLILITLTWWGGKRPLNNDLAIDSDWHTCNINTLNNATTVNTHNYGLLSHRLRCSSIFAPWRWLHSPIHTWVHSCCWKLVHTSRQRTKYQISNKWQHEIYNITDYNKLTTPYEYHTTSVGLNARN